MSRDRLNIQVVPFFVILFDLLNLPMHNAIMV
jgi:hypothetical protein